LDDEPIRYLVERPYDLSQLEYITLKKASTLGFWCNIIAGGTAGIVLSIIGKALSSLIAKENPELQVWEIVAVIVGTVLALLFKYCLKNADDAEKSKLVATVDEHFITNKPRRLHVTNGGGNDEH